MLEPLLFRRAQCPACHVPLTRRNAIFSAPRPCAGCGSLIKPVAMWDNLGSGCFAVLHLLALPAGFWLGCWLMVTLQVLVVLLGFILYPYITPFEVVDRQKAIWRFCGVCGYDLRATPDRCPECGTTVTRPPASGG